VNSLSEDYVKTVRIQRPAKVTTDERGHTVWTGKLEYVELELISTTALHKILKSGDKKSHGEIRKVVSGSKEGILARNPATGSFEIVGDVDLHAALERDQAQASSNHVTDATPEPPAEKMRRVTEELSLVSTQMLRKVLKPDSTVEYTKPTAGGKDEFGGFDPYNKS